MQLEVNKKTSTKQTQFKVSARTQTSKGMVDFNCGQALLNFQCY